MRPVRRTIQRRFTPTGVGTAFRFPHPVFLSSGSPPQAWGRLNAGPANAPHTRFTPTGVGTASRSSNILKSLPVHPHRRGDGLHVSGAPPLPAGSPPQAWGRLNCLLNRASSLRFTPTGVGTAKSLARSRRATAVHPHRRGDGATASASFGVMPVHPHRRGDGVAVSPLMSPVFGSPPQAWGRRQLCSSVSAVRSVHPHRRGDGP